MTTLTSYSVYCFTNNLNNKKYIGLTSDMKRRVRQHRTMQSRAVVFCLAIKKHGFENFSFSILKDNLELEDAKLFERFFIKELQTMVPMGYNRTQGGDASVKHSQETIEKIREKNKIWLLSNPPAMKGRVHSKETRALLSQRAKERVGHPCGEQHWNYGKKVGEATRKKISISQSLGKNGFATKVIDLNTNIVYSSIAEAKTVYGISHSFISLICSGKRTSKKYNFKYLEYYEQEKCLSYHQ